MRTGWRDNLRTALAGSLFFGGTIVASLIAESLPASAASVVQTIGLAGGIPQAVSSDGTHVWVTAGNGIPGTELNASTGAVVQTIGALADSYGVSSDGTHVWIASNNGSSVTELNASTGQVVQTIYNPEDTDGGVLYAVSSDGAHVWVTDDLGNTVTELDASTGVVVQTIAVGDTPKAVSSDGTHVWVVNYGDNSVTELNASTGAVVQTIGVPLEPVAVSSDGAHLWVTSAFYSSVTELDASTGAVVRTINTPAGAAAVSSDGTNVWVAGGFAGEVTELNASTGAVVETINLLAGPAQPKGISSDGTHVWVADTGSDGVSEIATGSDPMTAVVLPANNATVSGTAQYLDATASGVTKVSFELNGGPSDLSDMQVATGHPTFYGWLAVWNTTTVPNGTYTLQSVASAGAQVLAPSAATSVTVDNPAPAATVVLPANNATVSGTAQYLDATASSGVTKVNYEVSGGPSDLSDVQVAAGHPTFYGWLAVWNTTTVPNGTYALQSVASYTGGVSGTSAGITVTVSNPAPAATVVLPANNATVSGTAQYLDATASSGVTKVNYEVSGGPSDLSDVQVTTGTPTLYGWLAVWNTTTVPNGTYALQSVASYAGGVSGTSPGITVTISN